MKKKARGSWASYRDEKNLQDIRRGLADKYVFVHNQIKYNKQEMN